jgi:hypothetical protein
LREQFAGGGGREEKAMIRKEIRGATWRTTASVKITDSGVLKACALSNTVLMSRVNSHNEVYEYELIRF